MGRIEVDTDDLTLFSDNIKGMIDKIDNLDETINQKFNNAKEFDLYTEGFKKVKLYLSKRKERMEVLKSKIDKYQSDLLSLEKKCMLDFENIVIPNVSTTIAERQPAVQPSVVSSEVVPSIATASGLSSNNSSDVSPWLALAGLAGVAGVGGLAAATMINSRGKKEDKKEEVKESVDRPVQKPVSNIIQQTIQQPSMQPVQQTQINSNDNFFTPRPEVNQFREVKEE